MNPLITLEHALTSIDSYLSVIGLSREHIDGVKQYLKDQTNMYKTPKQWEWDEINLWLNDFEDKIIQYSMKETYADKSNHLRNVSHISHCRYVINQYQSTLLNPIIEPK